MTRHLGCIERVLVALLIVLVALDDGLLQLRGVTVAAPVPPVGGGGTAGLQQAAQLSPLQQTMLKNSMPTFDQLQQYQTKNAQYTCPADYNSEKFVGPGCECNPVPALGYGLCPAGHVCAEPWAMAAMERAVQEGSDGERMQQQKQQQKNQTETPRFSCQPCFYGQLCLPGSSLPVLSSSQLQTYVCLYLFKLMYTCTYASVCRSINSPIQIYVH